MTKGFYKGFTLSETLIALAIVGVIAVLTVPNIIEEYNAKVWNSAESVFLARMEDAMETMRQTGTLDNASTEAFVEELRNYVTINNVCKSENLTDCFVPQIKNGSKKVDVLKLKSSSEFGHKEYGTEVIGFKTINGVDVLLVYNKNCEVPDEVRSIGMRCVSAIYDVNSKEGPNKISKDIRLVNTVLSDK